MAELQVPLQLVEDSLAGCMHAEVLERELVVGDVWLRRRRGGAAAEQDLPHQRGEEEQLLRYW